MIVAQEHDLDAQLMVRVGNGETELFEQLVDRYRSRVAGLIQHMLPGGCEVDDLTQGVFMRVFQARESYSPTAKFSTWLFLVTKNVVLNERRRLARRREIPLDGIDADRICDHPLATHSGTCNPLEETMRLETQQRVQSAIKRLSRRQQQVIRLVYFNGYRYRTAGQALNVSEKAIKSLVHRAKQNLKVQL